MGANWELHFTLWLVPTLCVGSTWGESAEWHGDRAPGFFVDGHNRLPVPNSDEKNLTMSGEVCDIL